LAIDAVEHGHFSTIARYLSAAWVGLELCLALAFARLMATRRLRWLGFASWAFVLALGCVSFALRRDAENWWTNTDDIAYQAVARRIGELPHTVVVIENRDQVALELVRYLPPQERLLLVNASAERAPIVPAPAYLVAPTSTLLRDVRREDPGEVSNVSPVRSSALSQARGAVASGRADAVGERNALWLIAKRKPPPWRTKSSARPKPTSHSSRARPRVPRPR
jgi:hypothetical protein